MGQIFRVSQNVTENLRYELIYIKNLSQNVTENLKYEVIYKKNIFSSFKTLFFSLAKKKKFCFVSNFHAMKSLTLSRIIRIPHLIFTFLRELGKNKIVQPTFNH